MPARILVVEDESILALYIGNALEHAGYEVTALVSSGEEAILEAADRRPDLVLMDIRIKGDMDGIDAAELIYDRYHIPVIYLTAHADDHTLNRAKLTKPFGYLIKPFSEEDLRPAIEIALERHRLEARQRGRERWLSRTLQSIREAIIVTDAQGSVSFMTSSAEGLIGWSAGDAQGRPLPEVLALREGTRDFDPGAAVLEKGALFALTGAVLTARNGERHAVDVSAAPILEETGSVIGTVVSLRGTAGGAAAAAATDAADPLQLATYAAQLASLGIVAMGIAHEIDQPLNAISINAEAMLYWHRRNTGMLPDTFVRKVEDISRFSERIRHIVEHFRTAGANPEQLVESLNFGETVEGALAQMDRRTREHGVRLEQNLGDGSCLVPGSPQRLAQVVTSLINFALHSLDRLPAGDKWIRVLTRSDDERVILEVRDNGIAMQMAGPENLATPLSAFTRENDPGVLSLTIARLFTQELGGSLECCTDEGVNVVIARFPRTATHMESNKNHANPAD